MGQHIDMEFGIKKKSISLCTIPIGSKNLLIVLFHLIKAFRKPLGMLNGYGYTSLALNPQFGRMTLVATRHRKLSDTSASS